MAFEMGSSYVISEVCSSVLRCDFMYFRSIFAKGTGLSDIDLFRLGHDGRWWFVHCRRRGRRGHDRPGGIRHFAELGAALAIDLYRSRNSWPADHIIDSGQGDRKSVV